MLPNTHKFTGDERDSETNLDLTWFRQYSSQLGRWMHPDPAGLAAVDTTNPQSWNRYSYVLNSPLTLIDPLGLDCQWVWSDSGVTVICTPLGGGGGGGGGGGSSSGGGGCTFFGPSICTATVPPIPCSPPLVCGSGGSAGNSSGPSNKNCGAGQSNQTTTIVSASLTTSAPTKAGLAALGMRICGPVCGANRRDDRQLFGSWGNCFLGSLYEQLVRRTYRCRWHCPGRRLRC